MIIRKALTYWAVSTAGDLCSAQILLTGQSFNPNIPIFCKRTENLFHISCTWNKLYQRFFAESEFLSTKCTRNCEGPLRFTIQQVTFLQLALFIQKVYLESGSDACCSAVTTIEVGSLRGDVCIVLNISSVTFSQGSVHVTSYRRYVKT